MPEPLKILLEHKFFWFFLLALLFVLRFQTFFHQVYNGDEANYATHAMVMLEGGWPYADFVEKKPPLVYLFYGLSFILFGNDLRGVHLLTVFWIFLGSVFVFLTVKIFFDKMISRLTALLYVVSSALFLDTEIFATNCEILLNTPVIIGVYFLFSGLFEKKKVFLSLLLSGFFSSLSFLFKHQAGVLLPWVFLSLVFISWRQKESISWFLSRFSGFILGFMLPLLILVGVFWKAGFLAEFYRWNVLLNFVYLKSHIPLIYSIEKGVLNSLFFITSYFFFFYSVFVVLKKNKKSGLFFNANQDAFILSLLGLLFFSLVGVAAGGRFYGHYYVQLLPPLVFLAGIGFCVLSIKKSFFLVWGIMVSVLFFQVLNITRTKLEIYDGAKKYHQEIAELTMSLSKPEDKIFIWGNYSQGYYFSKRVPASRFVICEYLLPYWDKYYEVNPTFDRNEVDPLYKFHQQLLLDDLKKNNPTLILDTSTSSLFSSFHIFQISKFPELYDFVSSRYEKSATSYGVTFYVRK